MRRDRVPSNPDTYQDEHGVWHCRRCGGERYCVCAGDDMADPICDCGEPAYACACSQTLTVRWVLPHFIQPKPGTVER